MSTDSTPNRHTNPFIHPLLHYPGDQVEQKKKTDVDLPFIKVHEDEEGSRVHVGPINVVRTKTEEEVDIGPIHVSKGVVSLDQSRNGQLVMIAWALFLILIGCVWFVESFYDITLRGVAAAGIGLIWLGLNYTRTRLGIEPSRFTLFLGVVALAYGILEWAVREIEPLAVLAIAAGVYIILMYIRKI